MIGVTMQQLGTLVVGFPLDPNLDLIHPIPPASD